MRAAIPTELLWRLMNATPEQYAAVCRILGMAEVQGSRVKGSAAEESGLGESTRGTEGTESARGDARPTMSEEVARTVRNIQAEVILVRREIEQLRATHSQSVTEPATDEEARRLFALLKSLESESNYRKAPVTRVFQLYCLEGLTRNAVAKECHCAPSLVTLRLQAIEAKLGRKAAELRQLSGHFEQMTESLTDERARHIHRESAMDMPDEEWDE